MAEAVRTKYSITLHDEEVPKPTCPIKRAIQAQLQDASDEEIMEIIKAHEEAIAMDTPFTGLFEHVLRHLREELHDRYNESLLSQFEASSNNEG